MLHFVDGHHARRITDETRMLHFVDGHHALRITDDWLISIVDLTVALTKKNPTDSTETVCKIRTRYPDFFMHLETFSFHGFEEQEQCVLNGEECWEYAHLLTDNKSSERVQYAKDLLSKVFKDDFSLHATMKEPWILKYAPIELIEGVDFEHVIARKRKEIVEFQNAPRVAMEKHEKHKLEMEKHKLKMEDGRDERRAKKLKTNEDEYNMCMRYATTGERKEELLVRFNENMEDILQNRVDKNGLRWFSKNTEDILENRVD
jgi:hypothetical protein